MPYALLEPKIQNATNKLSIHCVKSTQCVAGVVETGAIFASQKNRQALIGIQNQKGLFGEKLQFVYVFNGQSTCPLRIHKAEIFVKFKQLYGARNSQKVWGGRKA